MGEVLGRLILTTMAVLAAVLVVAAGLCYLDPVDQALSRAVAWGAP